MIPSANGGIGAFLDVLAAPGGGASLTFNNEDLLAKSIEEKYRISRNGIPLFATSALTPDAGVQKKHYDKVANSYLANLSYPHTQEYMAYLDRILMQSVGNHNIG